MRIPCLSIVTERTKDVRTISGAALLPSRRNDLGNSVLGCPCVCNIGGTVCIRTCDGTPCNVRR